jgi:O-6-methylguanine DNA methyltransferase
MSDHQHHQLQRISTSWGDIEVRLIDGKVIGCALPYVDDTPTESFTVSTRSNNAVEKFICDTFRGRRISVPPIGELQGSAFQKMVWRLLIKIPSGETKSYRAIAEALGNPHACRAVANACGKNPAPLFIPCHRVIGSDGKLHGFSAGAAWKRMLLGIEGKLGI